MGFIYFATKILYAMLIRIGGKTWHQITKRKQLIGKV